MPVIKGAFFQWISENDKKRKVFNIGILMKSTTSTIGSDASDETAN